MFRSLVETSTPIQRGQRPLSKEMRRAFFRTGERQPFRTETVRGVRYEEETGMTPPRFLVMLEVERMNIITGKVSEVSVATSRLADEEAAAGLVDRMSDPRAIARANYAIGAAEKLTHGLGSTATGVGVLGALLSTSP